MNREFLKTAGVPDEAIDKIMAEYGKDIQAEKDRAAKAVSDLAEREKTIETYKTQVEELQKKAGDHEGVAAQLKELQDRIAEEKRLADEKAADEALTKTIREAFPQDRKFVNEYTEHAMIGQIKSELAKPENKGKGVTELFEALTKDKAGIFANPNEIRDMSGFNTPEIDKVEESKIRRVMGLPAK